MLQDAASVAKSAAMDDLLGPEGDEDKDNSLLDTDPSSGPNYAFVVSWKIWEVAWI